MPKAAPPVIPGFRVSGAELMDVRTRLAFHVQSSRSHRVEALEKRVDGEFANRKVT